MPQRPLGARKPCSEHVPMMARKMMFAYSGAFLSCLVSAISSFFNLRRSLIWESSVVARLHLQQYLGDLARLHHPFLEDKRANNYDWNITYEAEFARVVTCNLLTYLSTCFGNK